MNINMSIVRRIVNLRLELAEIMGHRTYANFVLERRMAGDTAHVMELMSIKL